ncbi:hypothetical protein [Owenweeksia hongkongensis]|uniref:hypothetical protein n=1 Tax=Owenweeksia hongkongensis TaxID=253245 RepID=UPI003A903C42
MKSLFGKFLLPLCILLLNGYGQVHAHHTLENVSSISETLHSCQDEAQYDQAYISKPFSSKHTIDHKVEVSEISEEENHIVPPVQFLERVDYFSALFYALLFGYLFKNLKGALRIGEYTPYFSSFSPLFLAFRVIRL